MADWEQKGYKKFLHDIAKDLNKFDIEQLCFLFGIHFDSKDEGINLMEKLGKKGIIDQDNLKPLCEGMCHIERQDIANKIRQHFAGSIPGFRKFTFSSKKILLLKVAKSLESQNIKDIKFLKDKLVSSAKLESVENGIQLVQLFEQVFENSFSDLMNSLRDVGREDLYRVMSEYKESMTPNGADVNYNLQAGNQTLTYENHGLADGIREMRIQQPTPSVTADGPSSVMPIAGVNTGQGHSYINQEQQHQGQQGGAEQHQGQQDGAPSPPSGLQDTLDSPGIQPLLGPHDGAAGLQPVGLGSNCSASGTAFPVQADPSLPTVPGPSGDCSPIEEEECLGSGVQHMSYREFQTYFDSEKSEELGKGSFGSVYKGIKQHKGVDVAVKVCFGNESWKIMQYIRETIVAHVRHPFLLPVFAVSSDRGSNHGLMYPYMEKLDLDTLLNKNGSASLLPWEDRIRIAYQVSTGLNHLHTEVEGKNKDNPVRNTIVHRDVKPGNILLDKFNNARLGDPGLAKEMDPNASANPTMVAGTHGYQDPEYRNNPSMKFEPKHDVFSLGVVFLRLLTGHQAVWSDSVLYEYLKKEGSLDSSDKLMEVIQEDNPGCWPQDEEKQNPLLKFIDVTIGCLRPAAERILLKDVCKQLETVLNELSISKVNQLEECMKSNKDRCFVCLLGVKEKKLCPRKCADQECRYLCKHCITSAFRNPLFCPKHGYVEPPIGHANCYALLIAGDGMGCKSFEKDVLDFKKVLLHPKIIGVRDKNLTCLLPGKKSDLKSTADNIVHHLKRICDLCRSANDSTLIFFYSGHGSGKARLVPEKSGRHLDSEEINQFIREMTTTEILMVYDCCYAEGNALYNTKGEPVDEPDGETECEEGFIEFKQWPDENSQTPSGCCSNDVEMDADIAEKDENNPSIGCLYQYFSSLSNQQSLAMRNRNSIFTKHFINALRSVKQCPQGPKLLQSPGSSSSCYKCDYYHQRVQTDRTGCVTIFTLHEYVSDHVAKDINRLKEQNPKYKVQSPNFHARKLVHPMKIAYYNKDNTLYDVIFEHDDEQRVIPLEEIPETLMDAKKIILDEVSKSHSDIADKMPNFLQVDHIHVFSEVHNKPITTMKQLEKDLVRSHRVVTSIRQRPHLILDGPVLQKIDNPNAASEILQILTTCAGLPVEFQAHEEYFTAMLPSDRLPNKPLDSDSLTEKLSTNATYGTVKSFLSDVIEGLCTSHRGMFLKPKHQGYLSIAIKETGSLGGHVEYKFCASPTAQ